jgi:hypothetical protein
MPRGRTPRGRSRGYVSGSLTANLPSISAKDSMVWPSSTGSSAVNPDRRRVADVQTRRRSRVTGRGSCLLRGGPRQALHVRARRPGDELSALDAARPRRSAVGGQSGVGARGHRHPAGVDATDGQLRPTSGGRRGGAPVAQAMVRALSAGNSRPLVAMARRLAPQTAEILAQHLAAGPPASPQTITPAQARERLAVHA